MVQEELLLIISQLSGILFIRKIPDWAEKACLQDTFRARLLTRSSPGEMWSQLQQIRRGRNCSIIAITAHPFSHTDLLLLSCLVGENLLRGFLELLLPQKRKVSGMTYMAPTTAFSLRVTNAINLLLLYLSIQNASHLYPSALHILLFYLTVGNKHLLLRFEDFRIHISQSRPCRKCSFLAIMK